MQRLNILLRTVKRFVKTSILGGVLVILPVAVVFLVFMWLYAKVSDLIFPLTRITLK